MAKTAKSGRKAAKPARTGKPGRKAAAALKLKAAKTKAGKTKPASAKAKLAKASAKRKAAALKAKPKAASKPKARGQAEVTAAKPKTVAKPKPGAKRKVAKPNAAPCLHRDAASREAAIAHGHARAAVAQGADRARLERDAIPAQDRFPDEGGVARARAGAAQALGAARPLSKAARGRQGPRDLHAA